jgi:flavodoxin
VGYKLKGGSVKYCGFGRSGGYCFLIFIIFLNSCANAQRPSNTTDPTPAAAPAPGNKILVAYLSRTGNTREIAKQIQQLVGGDLIEIETVRPYPADYQTTVQQVARENETGYLPPLRTKIERIDQYNVVFLGFPTWGMQLPPPMKSFLSQYSFKGKTIIPFNSNAGYGVGSSFVTVKDLCRECNVLDGFTTTGGIERDGVLLSIKDERANEVRSQVRDWLKRIGVL